MSPLSAVFGLCACISIQAESKAGDIMCTGAAGQNERSECLGINEAQSRAITHYGGPCLVLAGPESGKTFTLVKRVKYLIEKHHIPPGTILVITYTKAAALSMQRRFIREMGGKVYPVVFGTFHAVFFQIYKKQYPVNRDCILNSEEKRFLLTPILRKQNMEENMADDVLSCISLYKNGFPPAKLPFPDNMDYDMFRYLAAEYDRQAAVRGKMDFDDMLVRCRTLFQERAEIQKYWQGRFGQILVDEFQDCNSVQYELVKSLSVLHRNLFVTGDDDQAIYGFRGASPGIMRQFERDFPDAEKIFLEANYRSREGIVTASRRVIAENKERFPKNMFAAGSDRRFSDMREVSILPFAEKNSQFSYLSARLSRLSDRIPYGEMAVIFRTNREIESLLPFLVQEGIPFSVKSPKKGKCTHFTVQDIAAYLQLAAGKRERKLWLRILNKPDRGVRRELLTKEMVDLQEMIRDSERYGRPEETAALRRLGRLLDKIKVMSPYLAISMVRYVVGYEGWLKQKARNRIAVYENWKEYLDAVQKEAGKFEDIKDWLSFIKQEEENAVRIQDGQDGEGVQLMTMHASKGLEFSYVGIPNVNEGIIPYGIMPDMAAEEEERRLFFVGMTRAKTALDILYLTGTKEHPRLPSRFLNPILKAYSVSSSTSSSNS